MERQRDAARIARAIAALRVAEEELDLCDGDEIAISVGAACLELIDVLEHGETSESSPCAAASAACAGNVSPHNTAVPWGVA